MRDDAHGMLVHAARMILTAIGEDSDRPEIKDTPERFAKWWMEFIGHDDQNRDTTFPVIEADQMVVVSGMRVWSLCEHHLLPFWCDVSIGYIAESKVLGLSKFGRIAHQHAHRLQVQERLVRDIAEEVKTVCETDHVAVIAKGEHLCMTMRGVKTPAQMISSAMHGAFRESPEVRSEFMSLASL